MKYHFQMLSQSCLYQIEKMGVSSCLVRAPYGHCATSQKARNLLAETTAWKMLSYWLPLKLLLKYLEEGVE